MPYKNGTFVEPTDEDLKNLQLFIENPNVDVQPEVDEDKLYKLISTQLTHNQSNKRIYETIQQFSSSEHSVDIVLPIYGGLHVALPCIESVLERTKWPYHLYIMDDNTPDQSFYELLYLKYCRHPNITVTKQDKNQGFAANVNDGIKLGSSKYVCVLNSDVLVTGNWLTKLIMALESDPKNMIANPCTNNTAIIDVPMYPGRSYLDMNRALERHSKQIYPEIMPTGFCFAFKRSLTNRIGLFDEGFTSYGEETDFWFRTITYVNNGEFMNYKAVLADDCYVFHERGSSFSQLGSGDHNDLRNKGSARFHKLHPTFGEWRKSYKEHEVLKDVREIPLACFNHKYKYNIAWVVKSTKFCGGMKYISDIINNLIEHNINAKVVCVGEETNTLNDLHTAPIFFNTIEDLLNNFTNEVFDTGFVVSSTQEILGILDELNRQNPLIKVVNHMQSYDIELTLDSELTTHIKEQLQIARPTLTNASWISDKVKEEYSYDYPFINPGVDHRLFHPRHYNPRKNKVLISLNSEYYFKGYLRGVEFCKALVKLCKQNKKALKLYATGVLSVPEVPEIIGLGEVSAPYMAELLGSEIKAFVDPAFIHSYGLPILEAYCSGAIPFCWDNKGVREYYDKGITVFKSNTPPELAAKEVFQSLESAEEDKNIVGDFAISNDIVTAHDRSTSVSQVRKFLQSLIGEISKTKEIVLITPHLRKFGGPTTIVNFANILKQLGHNVVIKCIYDDYNPTILRYSQVPIHFDYDNIPECDVLFVNSDNPYCDMFIKSKAKKKVLLKLSHNERFKKLEEGALNLPWDHIITSSEWLRQACLEPLDDWSHLAWPASKVTRVGWYHYEHDRFNTKPNHRTYMPNDQIRVGTLVHAHPLKGSQDAMVIFKALRKKYGDKITLIGMGECTAKLPEFVKYAYKPTREEMATVFSQVDIWLNCSYTEGLGRMALEAMSSGAAVVSTDTSAEFLSHERNCLLYDVGDNKKGAEAVDKLIQDSKLFGDVVNYGYQTAKAASDPTPYVSNINYVLEGLSHENS